jgi:hypothetical protein
MLTQNQNSENGADSAQILEFAKFAAELLTNFSMEVIERLHQLSQDSPNDARDYLMSKAQEAVKHYGIINPCLEDKNPDELLRLLIQCELSKGKKSPS